MSHQKTCKPKHKREHRRKPCDDSSSSSSEDECHRLPFPPVCGPRKPECNPCKEPEIKGALSLLQYSSGQTFLTQNIANYIGFGSNDSAGVNLPDSYSTPFAVAATIKAVNMRLVTQTTNVLLPPTIPTLVITIGLEGRTYSPVTSVVGALTVYTFSTKNLCIAIPAGTQLNVSVRDVPVSASIAGTIAILA